MRRIMQLVIVIMFSIAALAIPTALSTTPLSGFVGEPAAHAATYNANARCQLVRIKPFGVVGYIEGSSSASTAEQARLEALRDVDARVPQGHYKRHCNVTIRKSYGGRF